MSKFIKSSFWQISVNSFIRLLSVITYPFLVRFFTKADIAVFKSLQSIILILFGIVPLGTNFLYLRSKKDDLKKNWNILFWFSLCSALVLSLLLFFLPFVRNYLVSDFPENLSTYLLLFFPILAFLKVLSINRLSKSLDFKEISLSLLMKQLILYFIIIISALLVRKSSTLILAVLITEIIEIILLLLFVSKHKKSILPYKGISIVHIDKIARNFIVFIGLDQFFNVFANQFPIIYVVSLLGADLAPEFQLPYYAANVPVALIMVSISKVLFPHLSEYKTNEEIRKTLLQVQFSITFILFPVIFGIFFFANDIVSILFSKDWVNAIYCFKVLSFILLANVLNNPFSYLEAIKGKPHLSLIYSSMQFIFRLGSLTLGYSLGGFNSAVLLFVISDCTLRIIRLLIDISLIKMSLFSLLNYLKFNFLNLMMLILVTYSMNKFMSKYVSFIIALMISLLILFYLERNKIIRLWNQVRLAITK